ncbi:HET-domain-containing protein, partial [Cadophora sp. DSE1049]
YICLSHCWGHGNPLETTTSSLPNRMKAIVFDDLSETFKDCIRLTRYLGIRYLWIDSLCIVQDSKMDWEEESSKMGDYYSSSWLTIGAGASTPKREALFTDRVPEESFQLQMNRQGKASSVYINIKADQAQTFSLDLGASALDSRGWTLQEQILPARFLAFGPTQVYYRNKEHIHCECGRVMDIQHTDIPRRDIFLKPGDWFRLVECYTKRSLTFSEDKLPALSGLAHEYQRASGDRYLAGIWSRELWKGLFWRRDMDCLRSSGPELYRAPSWSWAAVNGSIKY